jgi:hypothetical protein
MASHPLNNDIKICGETLSGRNLQQRSCLRYIPDGAFELGCFIAKDNVASLEYALPRGSSSFHSKLSPESVAAARMARTHRFSLPTKWGKSEKAASKDTSTGKCFRGMKILLPM